MDIVKNVNQFESPEEVLKVLTAGGDFLAGGQINEEEQAEFLTYVRAYGVMLAPLYQDLSQFPTNSPIGRAAGARFVGGGAPTAGPGLVPGGARMMAHGSGAISGHYDNMFIGHTITRGAGADGDNRFVQEAEVDSWAGANAGELAVVRGLANVGGNDRLANYSDLSEPAKFGRRTFSCVKLRSSYAASTEFFTRSIIAGKLNADLSAALAPRMVHDFEDLAINGDTGSPITSMRGRLLRCNDGWLKISRAQAPKINVDGEYLHWEHFVHGVKSIPDEYPMTDYKWWMNPHLWTDWVTALARYTNVGGESFSAALQGNALAPLGIPAVLVPLLPRNDKISVRNAANAFEAGHSVLQGREPGPFFFSAAAANDKRLRIVMAATDGDAHNRNIDVDFTTVADANQENRLLTIDRIVAQINATADAGGCARVGQHGTLELVATSAAGAVLEVGTVGVGADAASGANARLGFLSDEDAPAAAVGPPVAQGVITRAEGTAMWLSPAENFVWHVTTAEAGSSSTGIRMFSKFEQDMDRVVTDVYSYQDATIAMPHMMVVLDKIRCARPGDLNGRAF
jgi:hypothetical protein